jgi:hypothetical protein
VLLGVGRSPGVADPHLSIPILRLRSETELLRHAFEILATQSGATIRDGRWSPRKRAFGRGGEAGAMRGDKAKKMLYCIR